LVAHLKPLSGKARPVGEAIVGQLFAPGETGRVPVVAVSGTRHRGQVAQLVAGALSHRRAAVLRADASGLYQGDRSLQTGPAADAVGARKALMNPAAAAIVLETAERATLEQGLGFDRCQVAIVTTAVDLDQAIRPGVDEAATLQKALRAPVDVVVPDGYAVLNAAEPQVLEMAQHCKGKVVLFGGNREQSPVREHVDAGGAALVRLGSQLVWWSNRRQAAQLQLPSWAESTQPSLVEPLMAAAAAVLALEVSAADFHEFLNNFQH
jgi:cyanophycin synthetase